MKSGIPCGAAEGRGLGAWVLGGLDALPCGTAGIRKQVSVSIVNATTLCNKQKIPNFFFIYMYIKADNDLNWILVKKISLDIVNVQRFISDAEVMFYLETPAFLFLSPPLQPLTFFCIYQNLPALSPEIPLDFHNSPPLLALGLSQWSPFYCVCTSEKKNPFKTMWKICYPNCHL